MAQFQITIEIADEPVAGHALNKVSAKFGSAEGAIVDRIARANQATYPNHKFDPVEILVKTIRAAVEAAE